jgi:hypothetical protein
MLITLFSGIHCYLKSYLKFEERHLSIYTLAKFFRTFEFPYTRGATLKYAEKRMFKLVSVKKKINSRTHFF